MSVKTIFSLIQPGLTSSSKQSTCSVLSHWCSLVHHKELPCHTACQVSHPPCGWLAPFMDSHQGPLAMWPIFLSASPMSHHLPFQVRHGNQTEIEWEDCLRLLWWMPRMAPLTALAVLWFFLGFSFLFFLVLGVKNGPGWNMLGKSLYHTPGLQLHEFHI